MLRFKSSPPLSTYAARAVSVALLAALAVCKPRGTPRTCVPSTSGARDGVSWTIADCVITARSSLVELRWDAASGALTGLRNVVTGTELLAGSAHAAWSLAVDTSTDDIWKARATRSPLDSPTSLARFVARPIEGGAVFDLTFAPSGPVRVVQHVTLRADDAFAHFSTDVTVDGAATVVSIDSPAILGIAKLPGEQLAWPWHEGVIFPEPGAELRFMQYPAAASMQWMELFTPTEGLYYGVVDATGSYKELRFGSEPLFAHFGEAREMAASFYGYVTSAHAYTTPEVEIGVASTGGWYWGADHYREFLARSGMARALPKIVRELRGWRRGFARTGVVGSPKRQTFDYCSFPSRLMPPDYTKRTGISVLTMYGWHFDGFDTFYPDYDFLSKNAPDPTCLGGNDLRDAMRTLAARPAPNRVMFYMNGHIGDPLSDWFKDPEHAAAQALDANGQPYVEGYTTQPGRVYHVMCPSAKVWADRLRAKATELRTLAPAGAGAVGIYWDQIEEVGAEPCYVREHGHATPHSAFPEGYRALLEKLNQDFSLGGADTEYMFAAEGANDYYSQFIDIAGGMPSRPPGYAPRKCDLPIPFGVNWPCGARHAPELARYTMFARFLGMANFSGKFDANDNALFNANVGERDGFARAFLLGNAFRTMETGYFSSATDPYVSINTYAFPRYTDIYASEPEIYFYGTFVDAKGLTIDADPSQVLGTLIVGSNHDRIGVQFWNETDADRTVAVAIHLDALGLGDRAASALVDLDGAPPPAFDTGGAHVVTFSVVLPAHDVKALKVAL
jgi:hypothetical protein